jgi:hypothetical protein
MFISRSIEEKTYKHVILHEELMLEDSGKVELKDKKGRRTHCRRRPSEPALYSPCCQVSSFRAC